MSLATLRWWEMQVKWPVNSEAIRPVSLVEKGSKSDISYRAKLTMLEMKADVRRKLQNRDKILCVHLNIVLNLHWRRDLIEKRQNINLQCKIADRKDDKHGC